MFLKMTIMIFGVLTLSACATDYASYQERDLYSLPGVSRELQGTESVNTYYLYSRGNMNEAYCRRGMYHHGLCTGEYNPHYYHFGFN